MQFFPFFSFFVPYFQRRNKDRKSEVAPSLVHRCSIDCPSKRWSIDGLTMEYRWSIFGGRAKTDAGNDGGFFALCPTKICALYLKLEGLSGRNNAVLT